MRRLLVALAIALIASGCLRKRIDVCGDTPEDPECVDGGAPRDAAIDAAADAAAIDAGTSDAGELDAGEPDAGDAVDAGVDAASDGS